MQTGMIDIGITPNGVKDILGTLIPFIEFFGAIWLLWFAGKQAARLGKKMYWCLPDIFGIPVESLAASMITLVAIVIIRFAAYAEEFETMEERLPIWASKNIVIQIGAKQ